MVGLGVLLVGPAAGTADREYPGAGRAEDERPAAGDPLRGAEVAVRVEEVGLLTGLVGQDPELLGHPRVDLLAVLPQARNFSSASLTAAGFSSWG